MSALDQSSAVLTCRSDVADPRERRLRIVRWLAVAVWAVVVVYRTVTDGFAFNRELLLLYICTGLAAASIGQGRRILYVVRDWLPFALVLIAYDFSRGAATLIGRPDAVALAGRRRSLAVLRARCRRCGCRSG